MNTIQDDLNDLDRMVDQGAAKDEIRSQIRLIAREVTALQADYASLAESHAKLQEAHLKRDDALFDAIAEDYERRRKLRLKNELNYEC